MTDITVALSATRHRQFDAFTGTVIISNGTSNAIKLDWRYSDPENPVSSKLLVMADNRPYASFQGAPTIGELATLPSDKQLAITYLLDLFPRLLSDVREKEQKGRRGGMKWKLACEHTINQDMYAALFHNVSL